MRKNVPSVRRNSKKKGEYVFKFSQPAKGVRRKTNRRQHVAAGRPYLLAGDRKKKPLIACADEDRRPAIGRTGALICSKPRPRGRAPNAWAIATGKAFKAGDLKSIKDLATPAGKAAVRKHMAKAKRAAAPAKRAAAKRAAAPKRAARSGSAAKRAAPKRATRSASGDRAAAPRRSTRLLGAVPM